MQISNEIKLYNSVNKDSLPEAMKGRDRSSISFGSFQANKANCNVAYSSNLRAKISN